MASTVLSGATAAAVAGLVTGIVVWAVSGSALSPGIGTIIGAPLGAVFAALRNRGRYNLINPWSRKVKRMIDLAVTILGVILLLPLIGTIALLIKLDSPGPAVYGISLLGAGGRHFHCWKFRTMSTNAEQSPNEVLQGNPHLRTEWEQTSRLRDDPRVTRVGRFLRMTSLDELPQLWNVLVGEMSLVGPRPIVNAEIPEYGADYELYKRIRPGIVSLWGVRKGRDTSYPERIKMDAYYVRDWSIMLDLVVMVHALKNTIMGPRPGH